ncbi:MAG: hypothetical protein V1929_07545 [bacterium]
MQTRAFVQQSGENEGSSQGELYREPGRAQLVGVRTTAKDKTEHLDVVSDPETLQPVFWTRRIGNGASAIRTEMHIANGKIEARTYEGDKVRNVSTLAVPAAPWCVAPLIRFPTRFSSTIVTELESYTMETNTAGTAAPPRGERP